MKTQTRMIVASVVVIALALTAVSGITYSWFSDTEKTKIDVSTATLDLNLTVDKSKITNNSASIGTDVSYDDATKSFAITNLAASAAISIPYDLQYKSSISTVACVVAEFDLGGVTDGSKITIGYNGTSTNISDITDNKIVLLDWKTFPKADSYAPIVEGPITIKTSADFTVSSAAQSFSFTIKAELYQGNYPTTELTDGKAVLASNKVVKGESKVEGLATAVPVTVDLSSAAGATSGMELTVISKESSSTTGFSVGDSTVVDLSLKDSSTAVSDLSGNAFITVEVSGNLTTAGAPTVAYLGEGAQPTVVSYSYNATTNKTSVTFQTSHFSEFIIMKADEKVTATTADALALTLGAGLNVVVNDDITFTGADTETANYNIGIPAGVSSKLTVDSGKKITFSKTWGFKVWGTLEINGNGTFKGANINDSVVIGVKDAGSSITVNGGTYEAYSGIETNNTNGVAVYAWGGDIVINDGTFTGMSKATVTNGWLLNLKNEYPGTITVNGGTFVGYDPSSGDDVKKGTFVADDKVSVKGDNGYVVKTPDLSISTVTELYNFAAEVNKGTTFAGKGVILCNDLDLGGKEWTPIGAYIESSSSYKTFSGIFDGKGHTVSNFNVDIDKYAGFFGVTENAYITNLKVSDAKFTGYHHSGGIVGHADASNIYNCHVTGSEISAKVRAASVSPDESDFEGDKVGGIAGLCYGVIDNCTVSDTKLKGYRDIGGIVGAARTYNISEDKTLTVGNCVIGSNVTITQDLSNNYKNIDSGGKTSDSKYSTCDGMTWGNFCSNRTTWINGGNNSGTVDHESTGSSTTN